MRTRKQNKRGDGTTTAIICDAIDEALRTRGVVYFVHGQESSTLTKPMIQAYQARGLKHAHYQPTYNRLCLKPDERGNGSAVKFVRVSRRANPELMMMELHRNHGINTEREIVFWDHHLTEDAPKKTRRQG